ncbi:MAG: efflux RND transporter periplasmic adaptor subunit [Paracoccaceae bacterium]
MPQGQIKRFSRLGIILFCLCGVIAFASYGLRNAGASAQDRTDDVSLADLATPVRLISLKIEEEILVQRQFLGRLEARQSAEIGFEFGGTIDMIDVAEGDRVKRGDSLASLRLDSLLLQRDALQANLSAVQTQLDFAEEQFVRINDLVQRGAAPKGQGREAESERETLAFRLKEVEAAVEQLQLQIKNSELYAPFDGIIGARGANLGETVSARQPIVTIFESGGADLRVALPTSLNPADILNPRINLGGRTYDVSLKAVRPDIDFRTNTRVAIFKVAGQDLNSFGLSATLTGDVAVPERGAWVPVEAMRPSSEGYWIVLGVNDDLIADRIAVEVQYLSADQAYVIGAFETGTQIIGSGAHKVVPGQAVRVE